MIPAKEGLTPMTAETKSQSTNQILIWVGVAIVVLGVIYFVL